MSEESVRKDTFDETMKRIEAMMAASESRMSREVDKVLARYERDTNTITDAFISMQEKLDAERKVSAFKDKVITLAFTVMGLAVTLSAIILAGVQVYISVKGSSL